MSDKLSEKLNIDYKYNEDQIIAEFKSYIDKTYGEHYKKKKMECFDAWIARGTLSSTAIDTAEKYLWRYGAKQGKNKADLLKAMHYILLVIYADHYNNKKD